MLCCHVLLPCYVVVLGVSLCSAVSPVVMCVLSYIYIFLYFSFLIPAPVPAGGLLPFGKAIIVNTNLLLTDLPS
jgi:hypothetical protein